MFRNRWGALLFVAMTLASVTKLVGTESEQGTIEQATAELAGPSPEIPAPTTPETAAPVDEMGEMAGDQDLVDPAEGYDPTPADEFVGDIGVGEEPEITFVNPVDPSPIVIDEAPAQ